MDETTDLIEISPDSLVKIPEGYVKILVSEVQVILAISIALLSKFLVSYLVKKRKQFLSKLTKLDSWKLKREIEIKDIITEILFILKADRVVVSHFVNGEITASGMPLKKLKITFEKRALGISSLSDFVDEVPVSKILTEVQDLIACKDWVISVNRLLPESICRAHLSSLGVKAQAQKILIKDGIPVAILTIQFVREEFNLTKETLEKPEIHDLFSRLLLLV